MKTVGTLFILSFCLSLTSNAQTSRGSWLIGGSVTGAHEKKNAFYGAALRTTSIESTPQAGYFALNRFCVGLSVNTSSTKQKIDNVYYDGNGTPIVSGTSKSTSLLFGVGPFVRYYVPISKIFLISEVTYQSAWGRFEGPAFDQFSGNIINRKIKYDQQSFSVGAGPAFFVGPNVSIELLIRYKRLTDSSSGQNEDTDRFFISAGLQFYLPSKAE